MVKFKKQGVIDHMCCAILDQLNWQQVSLAKFSSFKDLILLGEDLLKASLVIANQFSVDLENFLNKLGQFLFEISTRYFAHKSALLRH